MYNSLHGITCSCDMNMQMMDTECDGIVFRKRSKASKLMALRDTSKTSRHYRIIESIFVSMCNSKLFNDIDVQDENDWIVNHQSDEQTFNDWCKSYNVVKSNKSRICIQPIGDFSGPGQKLLSWLQSYCSAYYFGIKVAILPPISITKIGCKCRINSETRRCQLRATDIIDHLKLTRKPHAICTVAVTMLDLYPKESWNFVFGLASLTYGVGVFSFARYTDTFYRTPPNKDTTDNYTCAEVTAKLLWRACKVMTHEIGHMFGIKHCVYHNCAMNGSNHLAESDRRAPSLCPICLRKLQEALKFDLADRYGTLLKFCEGSLTDSQTPLSEFAEYGEWLKKAVSFLESKQYKTQVGRRPR
ncbi:hypothetical protein ACHWQZ_G011716 [Mnemiopsis leidyi]